MYQAAGVADAVAAYLGESLHSSYVSFLEPGDDGQDVHRRYSWNKW